MKGVARENLPEKNCAACGRPFRWRKKWARDWDNVRYCSDACRSGRRERRMRLDGKTGSGVGHRTG
jgi:hypothetical protein